MLLGMYLGGSILLLSTGWGGLGRREMLLGLVILKMKLGR